MGLLSSAFAREPALARQRRDGRDSLAFRLAAYKSRGETAS